MNVLKPFTSILVVLMLVTATVVIIPSDDTVEDVTIVDSPYYNSDLYKVMFEYPSGMFMDYVDTCYYTDEYFFGPSTVYDPSLATMSLSLCMAAFMSNEGHGYSHRYQNAKDLLMRIGFTDVEANHDFSIEPSTNTLGVVMANKAVTAMDGDYTLVTVAIRGSGYGAEWVENFQMGTGENSEGHHEGFYNAMGRTLTFMESYIADKGISGDIKLWITGYSRAAAVSNMVAGHLDTQILDGSPILGGDVSLEKDDLFAYTFGTPMGAHYDPNGTVPDPRSEHYGNIWNIINKNDFVPKLAMSAMGFCRYGTDIALPDSKDAGYEEKKEVMLEYYRSMDSKANLAPYTIDDFVAYRFDLESLFNGNMPLIVDPDLADATAGEVLDIMLANLTDAIGGREGFVENIESDLCGLLAETFEAGNEYHLIMFFQVFSNYVMNADNGGEKLYLTLAKDLLFGTESKLANDLRGPVEVGLRYSGMALEESEIPAKAVRLSNILASLTLVLMDDILTDMDTLNGLISLFLNFDKISIAHYPELALAWLRCDDRNFSVPE